MPPQAGCNGGFGLELVELRGNLSVGFDFPTGVGEKIRASQEEINC